MSIQDEVSPTIGHSRNSRIRLAVSVWAAVQRRERAVEPATAAFQAAVPGRIRGDEHFQQALEDAETAESLERAIALHEGKLNEWAHTAYALLRAVQTADDGYERELAAALDAYRNSTEAGNGDINGIQPP